MLRVVFLGTPDFAAIPLEALAHDERYTLVGVVTQPDRPSGRGRAPEPPPVKQAALRLGLPVLQPETLREEAAIAQLAELRPDVGVVAAYGEILRKAVLAIPPLGYLNIHPSLLPRHRGPTPVPGAILAGDAETGVSVMRLNAKMDAGPILAQQRVPLSSDARAKALTTELFELGASLLLETLAPYAAGEIEPIAQDDSQATYTALLKKTDGAIDWRTPAEPIERMTRAYDPWPGAWTSWRDQPLKVIAARVHAEWAGDAPPGALLERKDGAWVATGAGALELLTVQPAGKRALAAADWRHGLHDTLGARLGE
ncbi:MAG TPA: methionyl-tRNA formyltransferase [Roseiflexaceae bacterium]|nr:methionyl-tRNA formyltransferase [Roseiflexaceae bacterium]